MAFTRRVFLAGLVAVGFLRPWPRPPKTKSDFYSDFYSDAY